jgi:hypothetical protein
MEKKVNSTVKMQREDGKFRIKALLSVNNQNLVSEENVLIYLTIL